MYKRIFALFCAAMLIAVAALGELPEPDETNADMIIGESAERQACELTLYYSSADGALLTPVRRTIMISPTESIAERAVSELLQTPNSADLLNVAPLDTQIRSVEECGEFVMVDLEIDAASIQVDGELLLLTSAICNTLTELEGIEKVGVLINSRAESISGLPMGALGVSHDSVTVNLAQYQADGERLKNDADGTQTLTRAAAIYLPSANGQWLMPSVNDITVAGKDYKAALMERLATGLFQNDAVGGYSLSDEYVDAKGRHLIDISISASFRDQLILRGYSQWQTAASMTLTLCSFVPELDGIRIDVDGDIMTEMNVKGNARQLDDGVITRRMFAGYVGSVARLYFPDESGMLTGVLRAMPQRRARSAYSVMLQLLAGPSETETGLSAAMPEGITADDLLGVKLSGGVLYVNMSYNFYRLCQNIDEAQERLLVYSIVNTMCAMRGVDAVSILIEGERVETLTDSIYLKTELMPNPGLIRQ